MKKEKQQIMVWTWAGWEPLQFYRRLGGFHEAQEGNALWADDWSRLLHSEETAKALADAGINWVTTHFYKGFGLEAEAEEIADTARLIRNFHRHGVKVFTYIQYGTIMPETIEAENPAAADWGRRDWNDEHDGHPFEYGNQYWRRKPCANQPGFREHLLACVTKAVEIGADGIWVDNLNADGCHCPCCQDAFRAYVGKMVKDPWRDLGLRPEDLPRVTIPRAERPRDPLFQLWIRCRCEEVKASLELICRHARQLKPGVVLAANIGIGNHQRHVLENANWISNLAPLDYTYAENGLFPAWRDGKIISQHYSFSLAESVGVKVVPGAGVGSGSRGYPRPAVPAERQLRRCFAESAMFGGHAYGGPWGLRGENAGEKPILLRDAAWRQLNRGLADGYARLAPLLAGSTDASPVALFYGFEPMLADEPAYRRSLEAMAQVLMQNQVPFRYLLSDRLESLSQGPEADGVRLLILPHVLPLSDAAAETIRRFVKQGGKVLGTGRCSLYDEWMRQRRDYALADLFGAHFSNSFEDQHHDAIVRNPQTGCVLIPGAWGQQLENGAPASRVTGEFIVREIRRLLPLEALPEVVSPVPEVGCAMRRLQDGSRLLALLNYGNTPVRGLSLRLAHAGTAPLDVRAFNAVGTDLQLRVEPDRGAATCTLELPELEVEAFLLEPAS